MDVNKSRSNVFNSSFVLHFGKLQSRLVLSGTLIFLMPSFSGHFSLDAMDAAASL